MSMVIKLVRAVPYSEYFGFDFLFDDSKVQRGYG